VAKLKNLEENLSSFKVNITLINSSEVNLKFLVEIRRLKKLKFNDEASILIQAIFLQNNYCSYKKPMSSK
jgi:hypothetical protein